VTSIQKLLGHKKLNTTMIYARAHNQTIEADYFAAMQRIETRLALAPEPEPETKPVQEEAREQILALTEQLAEPELSFEMRLELVLHIRGLLQGQSFEPQERYAPADASREWIPPPAAQSFVSAEAV
jgi:hypothetical protein